MKIKNLVKNILYSLDELIIKAIIFVAIKVAIYKRKRKIKMINKHNKQNIKIMEDYQKHAEK